MVLIVLLYVASIACCNWFRHGEKEGNIFYEQLIACNLTRWYRRRKGQGYVCVQWTNSSYIQVLGCSALASLSLRSYIAKFWRAWFSAVVSSNQCQLINYLLSQSQHILPYCLCSWFSIVGWKLPDTVEKETIMVRVRNRRHDWGFFQLFRSGYHCNVMSSRDFLATTGSVRCMCLGLGFNYCVTACFKVILPN